MKPVMNREALEALKKKVDENKSAGGEYLNIGKWDKDTEVFFFFEPLKQDYGLDKLLGTRHSIWINGKPIISRETVEEECPGMELVKQARRDDDLKKLVSRDMWKTFSTGVDYACAVRVVTFEKTGSKVNYKVIEAISKPMTMQFDQKVCDLLLDLMMDDKYENLDFFGYEKTSVISLQLKIDTTGNKKTRKYIAVPLQVTTYDIPETEWTSEDKLLDCYQSARDQVNTPQECFEAVYTYLYGKAPEKTASETMAADIQK